MTGMTLREVQKLAKNLRMRFPDRDIGVVFRKGRPKVEVS